MAYLKSRYKKFAAGGAVVMAEPEPVVIQAEPAPAPEPQDDLEQRFEKVPSLPESAKSWLREHPQFVLDQVQNGKISALHDELVSDGVQAYSKDYFGAIERRLLRESPADDDDIEEEAIEQALAEARNSGEVYESENSRIVLDKPRRERDYQFESSRNIYSAPPSREVPSSNGRRMSDNSVTLSGSQKEAARISGISEAEYAKQVLRLKQEKENGNYGGQG